MFAFCWTVHSVKSWPSCCWQMLAVCTKLSSNQAHLVKMLILSTRHVKKGKSTMVGKKKSVGQAESRRSDVLCSAAYCSTASSVSRCHLAVATRVTVNFSRCTCLRWVYRFLFSPRIVLKCWLYAGSNGFSEHRERGFTPRGLDLLWNSLLFRHLAEALTCDRTP